MGLSGTGAGVGSEGGGGGGGGAGAGPGAGEAATTGIGSVRRLRLPSRIKPPISSSAASAAPPAQGSGSSMAIAGARPFSGTTVGWGVGLGTAVGVPGIGEGVAGRGVTSPGISGTDDGKGDGVARGLGTVALGDRGFAGIGNPRPIGPSSGSGTTSGGGSGRRAGRVAAGLGVGVGGGSSVGMETPSRPGTSCAGVAAAPPTGISPEKAIASTAPCRYRRFKLDSVVFTRLS